MDTSIVRAPAPRVRGVRAALVVAVAGSALAGLIHAAAVRTHEGDAILVWMFGLCAVAQIAWAVVVAETVRPTRRVLIIGLVINAGAVLFWGLSRSIGIWFIASLAEPEVVGGQDLACALFAAASAAAAVGMIVRPVARTLITPAWTGMLAVFALLAAMPALTEGHTHTHAGHTSLLAAGHGEHDALGDAPHTAGVHDATHTTHVDGGTTDTSGEGHDHTTDATGDTTVDGGHDHGTDPVGGTTDTTGHDHGTTDTTEHDHSTTDTTIHVHPDPDPDPDPTGPIISLDDPRVTTAQRAIAVGLIDDVRTALAAFPTVAAVQAAGYISIGDGGSDGFEHYIKWSYLYDSYELDPAHIESIVVQKSTTGPGTIVSAMYILNLGKTMADVPVLAGELTSFHVHGDLCFDGTTLVGLAIDGVCLHGVLTMTPPMLHVWLTPQPCGPFAGIESLTGAECATHEH